MDLGAIKPPAGTHDLAMFARAARELTPGSTTYHSTFHPGRRATIHVNMSPLAGLVLSDASGDDVVIFDIGPGIHAPAQWLPLHALLVAHAWLTRQSFPAGWYARIPAEMAGDPSVGTVGSGDVKSSEAAFAEFLDTAFGPDGALLSDNAGHLLPRGCRP